MFNFFVALIDRLPVSRRVLEAYLVALVLVLAAFPDVVFMGASFRLTDQLTGAFTEVPLKPFYPIPNSTGWWAGYNDNGGATFQSEPMTEFMVQSIKSGETPYWNPYSAAGALGPEALVDQKFSALTLANALLGGGSLVYNVIILALAYLAVFFIYRIVREFFGLTVLAATGACVFYLLNGYVTANFGSNVTQSYLFVPACLYAALKFVDRPSTFSWSMVVFAFALFFSCTFMPTTITSLVAMGVVILGFFFGCIQVGKFSIKQGGVLLLLLGASLVASILILAPLYFPLLENLPSLGTLDDYSKRVFWPLHFPNAIPSFYSSTHLFESYNAMEQAAIVWYPESSITGNTVFHSGIIAIALAGCSFSKRSDHFKWIVRLCAISLAFVVVRLFDPAWIQLVFGHLPVIGSIGSQYWWPVIMFSMTFLIGFGINNLQVRRFRVMPSLMLLLVGILSAGYLFEIYGLHEPHIDYKLGFLQFSSVLILAVAGLFMSLESFASALLSRSLIAIAIVVMFVELLVGGKMIRFERNDLFQNIPVALQFVKDRVGLYRTLNFGQSGLYPELGSAFRIQEITTLNQGALPAYKDYFYSAINLEGSQRLGYDHAAAPLGAFPTLLLIQDKPSANTFDWDAVSFLGVKYILLPVTYSAYRAELKARGFVEVYESVSTVVFENKKVLSRAFTVDMTSVHGTEDVKLDSDFQRTLSASSIDSYRNGEVVISGSVNRDSLVVLSDNWHSNWTALLNGKKVPIVRVNGTFRGVAVPPGNYLIKMDYQPKSLPWALASSLLVLLLLALLCFKRKRLDAVIQDRFATQN